MRLAGIVAVAFIFLALVTAGIQKGYEYWDTKTAISTRPKTVEVRREAILAAYAFLASAAPGVDVEIDPHRRGEYDATIYVYLPPDPEPDMVLALETLGTVLPLEECKYRVVTASAD